MLNWHSVERRGRGDKLRYRDMQGKLRNYLVSLEPDPMFSRRLEKLCESLGAKEIFRAQLVPHAERNDRRGVIIGGAICSALPFVGFAAYAIRKHVLRRRVVPLGI
jgi:hypothetical protein